MSRKSRRPYPQTAKDQMEHMERRTIEHSLNEQVEQPLALLALKLRMVRQLVDDDPPAATAIIDELRVELGTALTQLREVGRRIYPVRAEHDAAIARQQISRN